VHALFGARVVTVALDLAASEPSDVQNARTEVRKGQAGAAES